MLFNAAQTIFHDSAGMLIRRQFYTNSIIFHPVRKIRRKQPELTRLTIKTDEQPFHRFFPCTKKFNGRAVPELICLCRKRNAEADFGVIGIAKSFPCHNQRMQG